MRYHYTKMGRLKNSKCASLMVRLAMVVNDISSVGLLFHLAKEQNKDTSLKNSNPLLSKILCDKLLKKCFEQYAFRMLIGHCCEGMKLIPILMELESAKDKEFCLCLSRLQPDVAADYEFLKELWVKGSPDQVKYQQLFLDVRDSVCFHYEKRDDYITDTITRMAGQGEDSIPSLVTGNTIPSSKFVVAEVVVQDTIFTSVWKASGKDDAETIANINKNIEWCKYVSECLVKVAKDLCWLYFEEKSN